MENKHHYDCLRAVIFDFDGVILQSVDIKSQAFLHLFADRPEHSEAILRFHLDNLGISRFKKFEWIYSKLFGITLEEEDSRRLGERFSAIVLRKIMECDFVPGAVMALEALQPLIPLFIASGTPQEELGHIVECRRLSHFFTEVWGTPHSKVEIIRSILERYGFHEYEVLFIGDGLSDFKAATEVGIPFLARENGTGDVDWGVIGAKSISDLSELPKLLGKELPKAEGRDPRWKSYPSQVLS